MRTDLKRAFSLLLTLAMALSLSSFAMADTIWDPTLDDDPYNDYYTYDYSYNYWYDPNTGLYYDQYGNLVDPSSGGGSTLYDPTVDNFYVTGVTPNPISLRVGESQTVSVQGSGLTSSLYYLWTSSNESVVSVSSYGSGMTATITARRAGSARVTVSVSGSGLYSNTDSGSCTVTVTQALDGLYISTSTSSLTMNTGEEQRVSVNTTSGYDNTVSYTWESGNTSVATVSGSGSSATIYAKGSGSCDITCKAYRSSDGDRDSKTIRVTVKQRDPIQISASPASGTLTVGDSINITTSGSGIDNTVSYTWSSSNSSVASISGNGSSVTVRAVAAGTATVSVVAKRSDGSTSTATVNLTVNAKVTNINVVRGGSGSYSLKTGQDQALSATVSGGSGSYTYSWNASGSVAMQTQNNNNATVRATGTGSGTVTLTVKDASTGSTGSVSWSFSVTAPVTVPTTPADQVGKVAGSYYATDIVTTVNGSAIESINVNGKTLISAEDLSYHGFRVVWDGAARTLSISKGGTTTSGGPSVGSSGKPVGTKLGDYFYTDIVTYLDGTPISAYNTNGRTYFCAEDMRDYGYDVVWNGSARSLTVTTR